MGKTEKQLADLIAKRLKMPVRKSREYLQVLLETLREDLHRTGQSKLRGLGTLEVHTRPARQAKHPITGELVEVPESKAVQFRASKTLKELINPLKLPKKKSTKPKADGQPATTDDLPKPDDTSKNNGKHRHEHKGKRKRKVHPGKGRGRSRAPDGHE